MSKAKHKKGWHPRMDRKLVSDQEHELDDEVNKWGKRGLKISRDDVRRANEKYNNSREDIDAFFQTVLDEQEGSADGAGQRDKEGGI